MFWCNEIGGKLSEYHTIYEFNFNWMIFLIFDMKLNFPHNYCKTPASLPMIRSSKSFDQTCISLP